MSPFFSRKRMGFCFWLLFKNWKKERFSDCSMFKYRHTTFFKTTQSTRAEKMFTYSPRIEFRIWAKRDDRFPKGRPKRCLNGLNDSLSDNQNLPHGELRKNQKWALSLFTSKFCREDSFQRRSVRINLLDLSFVWVWLFRLLPRLPVFIVTKLPDFVWFFISEPVAYAELLIPTFDETLNQSLIVGSQP